MSRQTIESTIEHTSGLLGFALVEELGDPHENWTSWIILPDGSRKEFSVYPEGGFKELAEFTEAQLIEAYGFDVL